ncbi:MAG TPA: FkbM family methyltransferase [Pyrinomonadaceae bacterium]|nr:FkbM family methyltransferase [Pyrinomonadaceae bacterium]
MKPEYLFRPTQALARFKPPPDYARLPWGARLKINPKEAIGRAIWLKGVYDLIVTESLWRLTDSADVAVDAGANIGYMTSVLSVRAQEVHAFEPHPEVFKTLRENSLGWENVHLYECALSNENGRSYLSIPDEHGVNQGLAFVAAKGLSIETMSLNALDLKVDILKLDVEGHELQLLEGAGLPGIRDIVFEEHLEYPSPVSQYLEEAGYTLFSLGQTLLGPQLFSPRQKPARSWEPQSYVATLEPLRVKSRFKTRGWQCLK